MRVSLLTNQAVSVLEYIKGLELKSGGLRGWKGSSAYPEVSGYLIPTLLDYGENELATRLADWLISIQGKDGSFRDMTNLKRTFDTASCMEGLKAIEYTKPALKARKWLLKYIRDDGAIRTYPQTKKTHLYTMRVSWLINSQAGAEYWMKTEWEPTREHYVAYALEGLWKMGHHKFVKGKLLERDWSSADLCANAQFAILYHRTGMDPTVVKALVNNHIGEIANGWTAKWILDMWNVLHG